MRTALLFYVRVAISTVSLISCLLLITIWVWSYRCRSNFQTWLTATRTFQCALLPGRMVIRSEMWVGRNNWATGFFQKHKSEEGFDNWDYPDSPEFVFSLTRSGDLWTHFPYWFPVLTAATFAALPWMSWRRFSMRTLLITMTLAATVMGLVAWATR